MMLTVVHHLQCKDNCFFIFYFKKHIIATMPHFLFSTSTMAFCRNICQHFSEKYGILYENILYLTFVVIMTSTRRSKHCSEISHNNVLEINETSHSTFTGNTWTCPLTSKLWHLLIVQLNTSSEKDKFWLHYVIVCNITFDAKPFG